MASSLRFLEGRPVSPVRAQLFHAAFAVCGIALFAATWKLWTPQVVFPQVPLLSWASGVPRWVDWLAFSTTLASLAVVLSIAGRQLLRGRQANLPPSGSAGASPSQAVAMLIFATSTGLLFLIDQHRLQPWAFQFVVIAIVLAILPPRRAFVLLRWLVVSIYFWSAVAKIDYEFLHTQGPQFVNAFATMLGRSAAELSPSARLAGSWSFPLAELLIAAGLCLPLYRHKVLRRCILGLVVIMHLLLIAVLSPWGLNHAWGVLIWNMWFIAQALLLFGETDRAAPERAASVARPPPLARELAEVLVELLMAAIVLLPALTLFGRWDHWLGWGLYAPRNSRATLYLAPGDAAWLGTLFRPYVAPAGDDWAQIRMGDWSLGELGVPIYPQDRFQLGAAAAVVRSHELQNRFQIIIESPPDRFTGRRRRDVITNMQQLERAERRFLFNTRARPP